MLLRQIKFQQRSEVLQSSGTNIHLIQFLIKDAQLLEDIEANHKLQVETLKSFQSEYSSKPWRITYEQPSEEVEELINEVRNTTKEFDRTVQDELNAFSDVSRNIIQLVRFQHLLKIR